MESEKPYMQQNQIKVQEEELEILDEAGEVSSWEPGFRFAFERAREALRYCIENKIKVGK